MNGIIGPIKMILTGDRMLDITDFQPACDSVPNNASGGWFNRDVVVKRKTNAIRRKSKTNLTLEVVMVIADRFMVSNYMLWKLYV